MFLLLQLASDTDARADGLMTKDGSLHVRQDPVAAWDSEKEEWYIKLLCGTFTFRGDPPIDVTWTVSSNQRFHQWNHHSLHLW